MALNPYLSVHTKGYPTAQNLYESMLIENIQISGDDYYYIPRELSSRMDNIFGEDVLSSFSAYAILEMYLSDFTGYGGEQEMISKFGIEVRNTATFLVSRKRYGEVVVPILPEGRNAAVKWRPCEGDLIYVPVSKSLFEIKFCDDESPAFYQLSKKYIWSLRCELVQLNNEKFTTGVPDIDVFNINLDRLNTGINQEDGFSILCEDGGVMLDEDYVISQAYTEELGFGNNDDIKKEFMEIMNFDEKNPFSERF
jgi:hypothetical protein